MILLDRITALGRARRLGLSFWRTDESLKMVALEEPRYLSSPFTDEAEERLIRNDPRLQCLYINGETLRSLPPQRLLRAINSSHVAKLVFTIEGSTSFPELAAAMPESIALHSHRTLKSIKVANGSQVGDEVLLGRIIQAVSQKASITTFSISGCRLLEQSLDPLLQSGHIQLLTLEKPIFLPPSDGTVPGEQILNSFRRSNSSLQKVSVTWKSGNSLVLVAILQGLQYHGGLQELAFRWYDERRNRFQPEIAAQLGQLLASVESIETLRLSDFHWHSATLAPLESGLRRRQWPLKISLEGCNFLEDETDRQIFCSIFEEPQGNTLILAIGESTFECLRKDFFLDSNMVELLPDGSDNIREIARNRCALSDSIRSAKNLVEFELHCDREPAIEAWMSQHRLNDSFAEHRMNGRIQTFTNIMDALALKTSIRILRLGTLHSPRYCELLVSGLPHFQSVRNIDLNLSEACFPLKAQLLSAFFANDSLTEWSIAADFLEDADWELLNLCVRRNACLPALVASKPGATRQLPKTVLPKLYKQSLKTTHGVGLVYQALVRLEDNIGPNV